MSKEQLCREHIQLIRNYRTEIENTISEYLVSNIQHFHESFDCIKQSLAIDDVDGFIAGTNAISSSLGKEPEFRSMSEFDTMMAGSKSFHL